jgi:hypothetical protein
MPKNYGQKIKLKWDDRDKGVHELDSHNVERQTKCKHTNMHSPPAQGNFCDKNEKALKLATVLYKIILHHGIHGKIRPHDELLLH